MAAIDFHYYGKAILAPVSIVLYNVLSGDGRGPELYGVEPWTYYVKNGLLNLNVAFPLALLAIPVLVRNAHTIDESTMACPYRH